MFFRKPLLKRLPQALALALTTQVAVSHANTSELTLDVPYNARTPTVEQVLGYDLASRISRPQAINQYLEALAAAHPDRMKVLDYGETWEGRRLVYAVISSAENIANLSDFEADMQRLADPRQNDEDEREQIISDVPASIWLSYGVHGNEISSPEAALLTAYHLLAAEDEETQDYLENTMIFIDPLQNPDGRGRFVSRYYQNAGLEHSADRISVEQNEPWPNGRTNHYLFDMNRDWIALTQPEIRGQIQELLRYYPLAFVDLHEMGGDMSYYFTPEAEPYNPYITTDQRQGLDWVGRNNAKWFDEEGFDYFTREIFDAFYPGYGASWPAYHGALSMTYEMASARGHHFRTRDGDILTYGDGVYRHFIASIATIETVSERREAILENFANYRETAISEGEKRDDRYLVLPRQQDPAAARKLAGLLVAQGVEVYETQAEADVCGETVAAHSFVIDRAQPAGRMVGTMLDQQIDMADDFIQEQERRRSVNLPDQVYDVTAWSLPLLFNLKPLQCDSNPSVDMQLTDTTLIEPGTVINPESKVGYLIKWGDMNAGRFLTAALREGLRVKSSDLAFTLDDGSDGGTRYPAGTLILTHGDNPEGLNDTVKRLAMDSGATVEGVDSSWVMDGPNFGSANVKTMHAPNIAMAWDEPVSNLSAGHTRFVIERQFNYPVTAIRSNRLASNDLSHYQVLILPSAFADYQQALGERGTENLKDWINKGGVLITLGNATRYASEQKFIDTKRELAVEASEDPNHHDDDVNNGRLLHNHDELLHAVEAAESDPYWVSGVLARTEVEQEHWLSAGVKPEVMTLTGGSDIYSPITIDKGRNIAWFSNADDVLASGYLWEENRQQLAYKPYLMLQPRGKGMVVSYTQEPTYRAYMDGLNILFMNSIFRSAAHAEPLR